MVAVPNKWNLGTVVSTDLLWKSTSLLKCWFVDEGFLFSNSKCAFINKQMKLHAVLENRSAEFLWSIPCREKKCPAILQEKRKSSSQHSFNYTLWNLCVSFCEDEKCFRCSSGGLPAFFTRAGHLLLVPTGKMRKLLNKKIHKTTPSSINKTQENTEVLGKIL